MNPVAEFLVKRQGEDVQRYRTFLIFLAKLGVLYSVTTGGKNTDYDERFSYVTMSEYRKNPELYQDEWDDGYF